MRSRNPQYQCLKAGVFIVLVLFTCGCLSAEPGLFMSLRPLRESVSLGEPVLAELTITNEGAGAVELDLGRNQKEKLVITVNDKRTSSPGLPPGGGISFPGGVELAGGESYSQILLLNEWTSFEEEGSYRLRLSLEVPHQTVVSGGALAAEAVISVVPRDPVRLAATCESLASQAAKPDAAVSSHGGRALSYVSDPACLPALARAVRESPHGKEGAITALARLSTPGAIDGVVRAWDLLLWDQQALAIQEFARHGGRESLAAALEEARKTIKRMPGDRPRFCLEMENPEEGLKGLYGY